MFLLIGLKTKIKFVIILINFLIKFGLIIAYNRNKQKNCVSLEIYENLISFEYLKIETKFEIKL